MKKLAIFILMPLLFLSCAFVADQESLGLYYDTPAGIYHYSKNIQNNPVGKWVYGNGLYFEFKEDGTWEYYADYGSGKNYVYKGTWSVHTYDGIAYLKLKYNYGVEATNPNSYVRYQIIEFYADDNFFGMNIYRKKGTKPDLMGEWIHNNYDYYTTTLQEDVPLRLTTAEYTAILNYFNTNANPGFDGIDNGVQKTLFQAVYSIYAGGYFYRLPNYFLTNDQINNIYSYLYAEVKYGGQDPSTNPPITAFWKNLTDYDISTDNFKLNYLVSFNRTGTLEFRSNGTLYYSHTSPFFTSNMGALTADLPSLAAGSAAQASAKYQLITSTLQDSEGFPIGKEVTMKWTESSNYLILGDWTFTVVIIKDQMILITFPFRKVR